MLLYNLQDSTIFALRISVKEHEQEIESLKKTIRQQHQSFQQSADLVAALKDGLLLQHKLKDQLAMELSATSHQSFTTAIRCLEVLGKGRRGEGPNWALTYHRNTIPTMKKEERTSCTGPLQRSSTISTWIGNTWEAHHSYLFLNSHLFPKWVYWPFLGLERKGKSV